MKRADLTKIVRREHKEAWMTRRDLGPLWTAAGEAGELFDRLAASIEAAAPPNRPREYEKAFAANLFIRAAGRAFLLDFLDLARRHWPESLLKRRRTLELVAYARIVWKDPGTAHKWLKSASDWSTYERAFNNGQIRGALYELHPDLRRAYDFITRYAHPSLNSVVMSLYSTRPRAPAMLRITLFDDRFYGKRELINGLKAERMLDALRTCHMLVYSFIDRCCSREPWSKHIGPTKQATAMFASTLISKHRHYHELIVRLEELREIRKARAIRRRAAAEMRARPRGKRRNG
jgi:hypothetical protein